MNAGAFFNHTVTNSLPGYVLEKKSINNISANGFMLRCEAVRLLLDEEVAVRNQAAPAIDDKDTDQP